MTQEDLVNKLTIPYYGCSPELDLKWIGDGSGSEINRVLRVLTKDGLMFHILWYVNMLTIKLPNNVSIWADNIWTDSCMPHNTKLDIRTSFKGIDSGFCIPILFYDNDQRRTNK